MDYALEINHLTKRYKDFCVKDSKRNNYGINW